MKIKKSGWKVVQARTKKKKKVKLALILIGILLSTLIIGNVFKFLSGLFKPVDSYSGAKTYSWDGSGTLYLASRDGENISFLVYKPTDNKLSIINIPSQTYMEVPGGFGAWEVRAIFNLGEKKEKGSELLKTSLSSFFGLPVDGYIEFAGNPAEVIKRLKGNPLGFFNTRLRGDLTVWELARLWWGIRALRADKIVEYDLSSLGLFQSENLPDGSQIFVSTPGLDSFISENLFDPLIKKEQLSIAVLNGTSTSGLAGKFSREITNLGGNVIISDNTTQVEKSFVFGQSSFTKKRLAELFGSKYAKMEAPASRAQVTVVLGQDQIK